ncbi:MAG: hypothetical protein SOV56_00260 [Phascolarctobacterium sp.]|nr:hypothetical protein [Phascolarctobacterium sp.]
MAKDTNFLRKEANKIKLDKKNFDNEALRKFFKDNCQALQFPDPIDYLLACAKAHGVTANVIAAQSSFERTQARHILSHDKQFDRNKLIALAIAGKLTLEETDNALKYAKFSTLYAKDEWDDVIIFALNGGLTTMATNELLDDLGYDPLVKVLRRNKQPEE